MTGLCDLHNLEYFSVNVKVLRVGIVARAMMRGAKTTKKNILWTAKMLWVCNVVSAAVILAVITFTERGREVGFPLYATLLVTLVPAVIATLIIWID